MVMNEPRAYVDPNAVPARDRRSIIGWTVLVDRYRFGPVLSSDLDSVEYQAPLARSGQGANSPEA